MCRSPYLKFPERAPARKNLSSTDEQFLSSYTLDSRHHFLEKSDVYVFVREIASWNQSLRKVRGLQYGIGVRVQRLGTPRSEVLYFVARVVV